MWSRRPRWLPSGIAGWNGFVAVFRTPLPLALLAIFVVALATPPPGLQQTQSPNSPCDRSRKVFTDSRGEFAHGPSGVNYTQDSHCEWLIKARNGSQFITLTFHSMGTECSYDYIYVYDGDSFNSTLLGSFSGKTEPQRLVASSGSMLILLYSDTNYVLEGFRASYHVSNCLNNCHNHGKCVGHKCVCHGEWVGPDCEDVACPDGCGERFGRGKCVKGMCKCSKNYTGRLCDLFIDPEGGIWRWIATAAEGMTARAAHSAVYIEEQDSLYVFGGYDLNNVLDSLQIYRFKKSHWEDEWGISLLNRHRYQPQKIDNTLLKAVLANKDKEEASRWGLISEKSLFRNVLYTLAEANLPRKQRSTANITEDEIQEILDDLLENVTDSRPAARYGHAAETIPGGFVIFGGKLDDGSLSNELWMYNISGNSGQWILRATNSNVTPPPLARHTLTLADGYFYVFGGSLPNGEFSSRIFRIKLNKNPNNEQWEEIYPRGGKSLDVRLVAHSTIFYRYTNSLIIYGGIMSSVARFSKLSDRIFCFQLDTRHWTEILYPRTPLRDAYIPRERAFHSASNAGNYMIVFGGYTHRHNKEEICYDNQMYLYHLGCHTWINQDVLGPVPGYQYPKRQGVFAHAAAIRMNNTLLIAGGYHGNVNADLFAYELPRMFRIIDPNMYNPEQSCRYHTTVLACLSDPECGWCSADSSCYGRTIGANCTTNLQTTRCPGICPSLGDCHSCLVHGTSYTTYSRLHSISSKLGLNQCTWCVQNARCHHKDDNYGVCGEDTPSQIPGWWGEKGTEIRTPHQCTELDRRPGLTYVEYHHPINLTMPDVVSLVNATMVDFISPQPTTHTEHSFSGEMMARLIGFVRPPKGLESMDEKLRVCSSYSDAIFRTGLEQSLNATHIVLNTTTEQASYYFVEWPSLANRFLVDFQAKRKVGSGIQHQYEHSKMELRHSHHGNWKAFTFEYLEPYSHGVCSEYSNCLQCLSDSLCGWCDLNNRCLPRTVNETTECSDELGWKYITIQPAQCGNCSNYISCEHCISTSMCEWWAEDARCARLGRSPTAIRTTDKCPTPCMDRKSCSDCLDEKGRCVWCEAKSQCFNFAVYTSEYQFGMCREWLDQAVPLSHPQTDGNALVSAPKIQQCKSCSQYRNCSSCLRTLSCGWCFDRDNPIDGICMQGDFSRSVHNCAAALKTSAEEAEWAYAQCPDVDECGLGLHNCHKEAKCTNTHGSYNCHCRKGYIGDGFVSCIKTCNETCIHGNCSGSPEYVCKCDLGWTGADCSINCGCNNHSTCENQVGLCDECQNWTEGVTCDRCRPGSYGNATSGEGCHPCECNWHGDEHLGICDLQTGECFCKDNTGGSNCDTCNPEYYGDPKDGGKCYFQCESRGILTQVGEQGIGSFKSYKNPWGGPEVRECLWLITPHSKNGSALQDSLIQIDISKNDVNVNCGKNFLYIYDSLPDLTGNTQQNQLLAVVCSPESLSRTIQARTGHLTVHYKQMMDGHEFGFNAMYYVKSCSSGTCTLPHVCNAKDECVCPNGFIGAQCETEICPKNCSALTKRGSCDKSYGRCVCADGYGGEDCSVQIMPYQLEVRDLFNTRLLSQSSEHFRKTIPRFGHSLHTDKRGSLWMFGGYSLSNGPLNDIRQFDTKNGTWMQVTVDSTAEAKMPRGRYFHAADISFSRQRIYIYGGLTSAGKGQPNVILGDFWEFSIQTQQWDDIEIDEHKPHPPSLAGHSLTLIRREEVETILLIGGVDIEDHHELQLWEFDLENKQWQKVYVPMVSIGSLYGHSAAYHAQSQIIYIFGGVSDSAQDKLYALNIEKMTWTELAVFSDLNRPEELLPRRRFFHSSVTTDSYMVIYGGRSVPYNASDILMAYVYECNQWIRLTEDVSIVGSFPTASFAEAMTIDHDTKLIYVVGGWDGSSESQVIQISLPEDLCQFWSTGKYSCRHYMGCSYCAVKSVENSTSHCYTSGRSEVCDSLNGTLIFNNGIQCDDTWMSQRNCSLFKSCTSCMSTWPTHYEEKSPCKWCTSCDLLDSCVPANAECPASEKACEKDIAVTALPQCPLPSCSVLSCEECMNNKNCLWASFPVSSSSLPSHFIANCMQKDTVDVNELTILTTCPDACHTFQNCSSCLNDAVNSDNPIYCRWSTALNACMTPNHYPLYCAGGTCGLVLDFNESDQCPEPCQAYTQCTSCLRHAHCGWCSRDGGNGDGVCTEGSLESFSEYPASSTCDIIYASRNNITELNPNDTFAWNYVHCPPENECVNGHHNCDPKAERCVDNVKGYQCICGEGYKSKGNDCVPICTQGCVRGTCIEPNVCECDFGYVGANCSIQCQCNGHSNCLGPDKLDECIQCHNNTMGAQCDKCKPLFVGNPKNNGQCVPCLQYCNGHSDVCVAQDSEPPVKNMTKTELEGFLTEGPISDAVCLRCANKTDGNQCEGCILGNFRGSDNLQDPCRPCECHGHGDICDPVSGEKCNCGNNTESDPTCSASSSKNSAQLCWKVQCSKCRESYMGNPIDGHQCYKQITVESRMCFDAKPIEECKVKPQPLRPGQTVFFVIQPRFMNVDIRVIIDVTQGELDVFMSPQDDSFIVHTNQSNGHHMLLLDNRYRWVTEIDSELFSESVDVAPYKHDSDNTTFDNNGEKLFWTPQIHDCKSLGGTGFFVKDQRARDLSTYITLNQCNTLIRLFGLRNRLVLTLPQNAHNLSATRFYIALRASTSSDHSYGSVVFRQDQLHIDLFVFFSVFFSCFFLFLAICVVAWKAKQAADIRRARRLRVVEMQHMANRPFARVRVLLTPENETPIQTRRRGRSSKSIPLNGGLELRPVAIEPTADNVAAVSTVFVSLPGKYKAPVTLALGSSLIVLSRQYPAGVRPFLRRRGSHHAAHPPNNV